MFSLHDNIQRLTEITVQQENNHMKDFCHYGNQSDARTIDFI